MACVGHIQQGLWRHKRDRAVDYTRLDHWAGLARTLERGLFDGLFLADVLGVYDVYGGSRRRRRFARPCRCRTWIPMLLIPAMAQATREPRLRHHRQYGGHAILLSSRGR